MTDKDDIEVFLRQLEIALRTSLIPRDERKRHLLSQLTLTAKEKVIDQLENDDSDYDGIKYALLGKQIITFASVAEAFFSTDNGELL